LDHDGNHIEQRAAQNFLVALYNHQIPPGSANVVHYQLDVPAETLKPISIEIKLQYRKFNSAFIRYLNKEAYNGNDLPIITLASDKIILPIKPDSGLTHKPTQHIATWERWNDYGIGLLRENENASTKGQLLQAETAFKKVESLGYPEGSLNLARVYLKEGRLDKAHDALLRAQRQKAPAWTVAWFSALIDRKQGNLDNAIQGLNDILATQFNAASKRGFDFSYDIQVTNTLGHTLHERAGQEQNPEQKTAWLEKANKAFLRSLKIDPENAEAHQNLALIYAEMDNTDKADHHQALHQRYRPDEQMNKKMIALHRSLNPAANHAAETIAIYNLQRPEAYEMGKDTTLANRKNYSLSTPNASNRSSSNARD
jgi:hypothetical protein